MKSTKSEGARNNQMSGAAASREAGPLFPRLHVSETEKAGPRAPPRNKMALFEQFTVPSHRFVQPQPSNTLATPSNQSQQLNHPNSYIAHCAPGSIPYSAARPQPSRGVSSCVTSEVSGSQTSEKHSFSRATTKEDGGINLSSLLEEKAKVVSDDVLMQFSPKAHVKTHGACFTSSIFQNICDKFASASAESAELPVSTATKKDLLEATSVVREGVTCPMIENQSGAERRKEVADAILTGRETLKAGADAADEQSHGYSNFTSEQSCQRPDVDPYKLLPEDPSHLNDLAEVASITDMKESGYREGQSFSPSGKHLASSAQKSMSQQLLGSLHVCKDTFPADSEKRDPDASANVLPKDKGDNTGDSQNNRMGSNEVSELSQQGTGRDIDDSPLSVPTTEAIRPKDVIRAVGQQHFWKARKALLRQQRIFSDQVFQLHKLIKVQQLLAETSGTLIDEEMLFDSVDTCPGSPSQCNIDRREVCHDENAHVTSAFRVQGSKDQGKTGNQPETLQKSQWYAAVCNDKMGSTTPYLPAFAPGGVSAWGYPSLGAGHWMGPSPAQGRPSAYPHFTACFPPGAPFGGLYGAGSVSPMMPFCFPHTGHRTEAWEELSSNGAPALATTSNARGAPALGYVAHDIPGAWQFLQYNNPYYSQRFHGGVLEKNTSVGSGASINHQRSVKPVHTSETGHILREGSRAGWPNSNGIEDSMLQSENSSPSSSAYIRSTPASSKAGPCHQKTEQPAQMSSTSLFRAFSSSKQHEANELGVRLSKRRQSDQSLVSDEPAEEAGHQSGQSRNALDLFPLVPSLTSDDEKKGPKQATAMWQGRVIKAVPHPAVVASQSAAGILLSLQRERRQ
ncbi:hypothetical protein L7F22_012623 [Adiantum nelumboides]|nr:hypothetical protein [Adiantum nelumboides]